jgi:WD40 repeat protein
MEKDQPFFTPQHVDEQIEQRARGSHITPEARLLQDMQGVAQQMSEEDQRALQRTWVRLQQKSREYVHASHHRKEETMQEKPFISPQTLSSSPARAKKPPRIRRQIGIAFAVAVVLIELFTWAWFTHVTPHSGSLGTQVGSQPAASATTTPTATANASKPLCTFQDQTENSTIEHANIEHSLSWSPDGKLTTTAWNVNTFDIQTCQQVASPTSAPATDVYWSPDGTRLLIVGAQADAQIIDQQGDVLVTHAVTPASVAFNATSPATVPLVSLSGSGNDVEESAWSPNGERIASVYTIGLTYGVEIWSATTGSHQRSLSCPNNYAYGIANPIWSPDGNYLAAIAANNNNVGVCVWNANSGEMVAHLTGATPQVGFSADSKELALGGENSVQIYSLASRRVVRSFPLQHIQPYPFLVAWSPNGNDLAVAANQDLSILDAGTGNVLATYRVAQNLIMENLAWSPDSTLIAEQAYLSSNPTAFVSVWHVQSEK